MGGLIVVFAHLFYWSLPEVGHWKQLGKRKDIDPDAVEAFEADLLLAQDQV
jgi:hypothetical protein